MTKPPLASCSPKNLIKSEQRQWHSLNWLSCCSHLPRKHARQSCQWATSFPFLTIQMSKWRMKECWANYGKIAKIIIKMQQKPFLEWTCSEGHAPSVCACMAKSGSCIAIVWWWGWWWWWWWWQRRRMTWSSLLCWGPLNTQACPEEQTFNKLQLLPWFIHTTSILCIKWCTIAGFLLLVFPSPMELWYLDIIAFVIPIGWAWQQLPFLWEWPVEGVNFFWRCTRSSSKWENCTWKQLPCARCVAWSCKQWATCLTLSMLRHQQWQWLLLWPFILLSTWHCMLAT